MNHIIKKILLIAGLSFSSLQADELEDEYIARLGDADHYSSSDEKLESVAEIIRQDRANFHKFKIRDEEDESDSFFKSADNRAAMEKLLSRVNFSKSDTRIIFNYTPTIRVRLYTSDETGRKYLTVKLLGPDDQ